MRVLAGIAFAALTSGQCQVDARTPCRTIRYHQSGYGLWPSPRVHTEGYFYGQFVEAFDADGSRSTTRIEEWRRLILFETQAHSIREIVRNDGRFYLNLKNQTYQFTNRHDDNAPAPWQDDDRECSKARALYTRDSVRLPDSNIAGYRVVGYRSHQFPYDETDIYLAPSAGCQIFLLRSVVRSVLGLPIEMTERAVDSFEVGPPDHSLFEVPANFKRVDDIWK